VLKKSDSIKNELTDNNRIYIKIDQNWLLQEPRAVLNFSENAKVYDQKTSK